MTTTQADWRDFTVPAAQVATIPPERRGLRRDQVRLLVAHPQGVTTTAFAALASHLTAGDLLVVNDSATLPAAVPVRRGDDAPGIVHLSTALPDGSWVVELRDAQRLRAGDAAAGERLVLPGGATVTLRAHWPQGSDRGRLWVADLDGVDDVVRYLARVGRPITYDHVAAPLPLTAYQTIFARTPGSAEMPSAGRPFSAAVMARLDRAGVDVATVTLHAGVSSAETGEAPPPEPYDVPAATAGRVNATRATGGRVIAVGTTVTRALETVADDRGVVHPARELTELVLGATRTRVVDGLVTGWHEPRSSHLALLEAVAGEALVATAYRAAITGGLLWHEFGDSCLLLPSRR